MEKGLHQKKKRFNKFNMAVVLVEGIRYLRMQDALYKDHTTTKNKQRLAGTPACGSVICFDPRPTRLFFSTNGLGNAADNLPLRFGKCTHMCKNMK